MEKHGSRMILPLICHPRFCQLSGSEAFRARGCIRFRLMPQWACHPWVYLNPFWTYLCVCSRTSCSNGFCILLLCCMKKHLICSFKIHCLIALLDVPYFFHLKQHRLLWFPDLLHAIHDFINLSSLLSASFPGWEVYLPSPYIKSVPKLWSFFLPPPSSFQLCWISLYPLSTCILLLHLLP